jgi:hypothetical protein
MAAGLLIRVRMFEGFLESRALYYGLSSAGGAFDRCNAWHSRIRYYFDS